MPFELHQECRRRLVDSLADEAKKFRVQNNSFLIYDSVSGVKDLENILPSTEKSRLQEIIGESPFLYFVLCSLYRKISKSRDFSNEIPIKYLTEIPEYTDPVEVAENLVSQFQSLPWEYTLIVKFPLPSNCGIQSPEGKLNYNISEDLSLIVPDDSFTENFPITPAESKIGAPIFDHIFGESREWDNNFFYLQGKTVGFIEDLISTPAAEDFQQFVKSFLGCGLAINFFDFRSQISDSYRKKSVYIYQNSQEKNNELEPKEYTIDESEKIESIKLKYYDFQDDPLVWGKWLSKSLTRLSNVFTKKEQNEKIINACRWYFDSFCGSNDLLSFIQATVSLEILLGEKAPNEGIGLTELLSNRCAYLIGISQKQRSEILQDFKKIYNTRSQIVHRGKNRLNPEEYTSLRKLRWICSRVITEEIELLEADEKM